jgi:tetratricopeptide (TPR) repeat protein
MFAQRWVALALLALLLSWSSEAAGQARASSADAGHPGHAAHGNHAHDNHAELSDFMSPAERDLMRGDLLYYEGDYYRAITAYKEFLAESGGDARALRVHLKIAWIYYLSNKPKAAEAVLKTIASEAEGRPEGWWSRLYLGHVATRGEEPIKARAMYDNVVKSCAAFVGPSAPADDPRSQECLALTTYARLGLARYHARAGDFDAAASELAQLPKAAPQSTAASDVAAYVRALEIPRKSPTVAGLLSIVPGLGHFYIEEYAVGIVAMIWNGAFIYATVDSILDGTYGQAAVLGLLELIWYAGTIFGAVAGAERFNRDAQNIVKEGLEKDIEGLSRDLPWPARFPAANPVGLKLEFDF